MFLGLHPIVHRDRNSPSQVEYAYNQNQTEYQVDSHKPSDEDSLRQYVKEIYNFQSGRPFGRDKIDDSDGPIFTKEPNE